MTLAELRWPRTTERLLIRPAVPDDHSRVFAYRSDVSVGHWIARWTTDPEEHREQFSAPERLGRTLVYELGGRVVGDLMLAQSDAWSQVEVAAGAAGAEVELGWTIDPAYAGRGLATEAVRELMAACFDDLGVHRVTAHCFAENRASWRLMERVGMRRESEGRRDALHRSRGWLDSYGYAILAEEWRAR
nr:GNAT family protein [Auraticoccus cholistanensis]